jgi:hypothetical protein
VNRFANTGRGDGDCSAVREDSGLGRRDSVGSSDPVIDGEGEGSDAGEGKTVLGIYVLEGGIAKIYFPITLMWSLFFKYRIYNCDEGKAKL